MSDTVHVRTADAPATRWPDVVLVCSAILAWLAYIVYTMVHPTNDDAASEFHDIVTHLGAVFTHLPRNVGDLGPVLLFLASAFGIGDLIATLALRVRFESRAGRVAMAVCTGLFCWTVFALIAGSFGHLNRTVLGTAMGVGLALGVFELVRTRKEWLRSGGGSGETVSIALRVLGVALWLLIGLHLYFALLGALAPEVQFDARFYHLAEAKRYADHGAFFNLAQSQGSVEVALPQNQESLYAVVYALFGLHAAKVLSWANLLLAILAICGFASEHFRSRSTGWLASLLFVCTPIVAWSATTAGNDLSLAPYTVLSLYAFFCWAREPQRLGWLVLAGLMCGFASGIKPFAGLGAVPLVALIAFNARWRAFVPLLLFALGIVAGVAPGMAREFALTGDPFYPVLGDVTHSPFWAPTLDAANRASIHAFGADTSWPVFLKLPWVFTFDVTEYRNVIGPLLLFALPFVALCAFLPRGNRVYVQSLFYLAVWVALWFATGLVEARYAEGVFPVFALLAAYLALGPETQIFNNRWTRGAFLLALLAIGVVNLQVFVPFQRGATLGYASGYVPFFWDYLYNNEAEDDVQLVYSPAVGYINKHLDPKTDKVYFGTEDAYFNVYSDIDIYDGITPLGGLIHPWTLKSPDAYERLKAVGANYVVVSNDAQHDLLRTPLFKHLTLVTRVGEGLGEKGGSEYLYHVL